MITQPGQIICWAVNRLIDGRDGIAQVQDKLFICLIKRYITRQAATKGIETMSLSGTLALLVSTIGTANIFTSGLFTSGADASEAELVLGGSTEGAGSSGAAAGIGSRA